MYDKCITKIVTFATDNINDYGNLLLSHTLDAEKQAGQGSNIVYSRAWEPILRRQSVFGFDGCVGQQATIRQKPLCIYGWFHRATGARVDEEPVGAAQFHPRRNGERPGTCDDENEVGKDCLQLPPSTQRIKRPRHTQQGIVDRLYRPLCARNGGRHKAQHSQTALRSIDNQELQRVYHSVRRVLQSEA